MADQLPEKMYRVFSFRGAEVGDDRTIDISISSETPVERHFGSEVLVHEKASIDVGFIGSGSAPLLLDHDRTNQIGVIESVSLDTKERKLRAKVRFGKSARAQEILDDVKDGIRSNISIGYVIEKIERDEKAEKVRVTRWMPFEASIVSVPADVNVGVGRDDIAAQLSKPKMEANMPDPVPAAVEPTPAAPAIPSQRSAEPTPATPTPAPDWHAREAEVQRTARQEAADITELGARHHMSDVAAEFVRDGKSLSEFRGHVLENLPKGTELQSQDIGLTQGETNRFSVLRLAAASNPQATQADRAAAAFEIEACQAAQTMAERSGIRTKGSQMPAEVLREWIPRNSSMYHQLVQNRTISAGVDTALVPEDYRPGSFIDVLRNQMSVMQAGATFLQGLVGNVDIPKKLTASAATWVSAEAVDATASEPTFGNVTMTPKDLAVYTDITRRARQQMVPDIEALIRNDIVMAIALGLDLAALEGTAAAGQPRGVLNTVGISKPNVFAGVNPTFAEVVALETALGDDNALMGNLAYILRTNMAGALKTTEKFTGTGQTIWEPGNQLNGYNAYRSNQGTDGNIYFGNWSDLLIGAWGTLDLQFDYAALALSGGLRLIAFQTIDCAVRHAESFAYGNDTP